MRVFGAKSQVNQRQNVSQELTQATSQLFQTAANVVQQLRTFMPEHNIGLVGDN